MVCALRKSAIKPNHARRYGNRRAFLVIIPATTHDINIMSKRLSAFSYYGGKNSKLDWLLPQLETPHRTYCELFAGSLAVMLNKSRVKHEVVNDLAGEIVSFWTALRDHRDEFINKIMDSPPGEAEFKRIISLPPTDDVMETGRRFYIRITQAFSGVPTRKHHSFGKALRHNNVRDNLTEVANRLRGVLIENTDACRLMTRVINNHRYEDESVLFYADPPYVAATRQDMDIYIHDEFNHDEFLGAVLDAPDFCKFAISGYDNQLYNSTLADWHRVELETQLIVRNNGKRRTEVLWLNYEPSAMKQSHLL